MPTIMRVEGLRIVVYPNDHRPANLRTLLDDWRNIHGEP
jgi:hypothetical protein